jgi:uncharacterized protein (DUF433 family)
MPTASSRIETNPAIVLGKPVIRGTRITVELILRKIAEGATPDDVVGMYPPLSLEDVRAALNYAADTIAREEIHEYGGPAT